MTTDPLLGHERTSVRFGYDLDYAFAHLDRQDIDPEWIARACRWPKQEEAAGYPRWRQLARQLSANADEEKTFHQELDRLRKQLPEIPAWLHQAGIDKQILARCEERCRRVGEDLADHETHD